jgi:hypothetical protein
MKSLFKSCVLLALLCAPLVFSQGNMHLGVRAAAGASAFRDHIALLIPAEQPGYSTPSAGSYASYAIIMRPAFSTGVGIAFAYDINSLISVASELQYTLYRANGRFVKNTNETFSELNEAGVMMHSLELPILARFNFGDVGFGSFYAEVGPQVGANLDAKMYSNSAFKSPDINIFAFGPSLGGGIKIDSFLIGLRGYLGILEYAENTNGYPWAAQVSLTKFFF